MMHSEFLYQKIPMPPIPDDPVCIQLLDSVSLSLFILRKTGDFTVLTLEDERILAGQLENMNFTDLKIVSDDHYLVILENKGVNGAVISLQNGKTVMNLKRGDYHADQCPFPTTLSYRDHQTFLIHGTDWNRLDITCLDTRALLTGREVSYEKSLNYFDYFHGDLYLSPDQTRFISSGWFWQPADAFTLYTIDGFFKKYELDHQLIHFEMTSGYHWERPVCWIDEKTIAAAYNRQEEFEEERFPTELLIIDVDLNQIIRRIEFNIFQLNDYGEADGKLYYDRKSQTLIGLHPQKGILLVNPEGEILLNNPDFLFNHYHQELRMFYRIDLENKVLETARLI